MFMRTNFFKNFRKDSEFIEDRDLENSGSICASPGKPSIWGSLDDSEASTSCDIDEDIYFSEEAFTHHSANCDGTKKVNSASGRNNYREDFNKLVDGIDNRKSSARLLPEKIDCETMLKVSKAPSSPPPSKFNPCESQTSPMLSFLKKKFTTEKPVSPDVNRGSHTIISANQTAKCDVTSTACCNDVTQSSPDAVNQIQTEIQFESVKCHVVESENNTEASNRLTSLYQILKEEASKLKRLGAQLQLQLNDKNLELQKAQNTIESLRKSNLEFQMSLENLSLKYKNEVQCRSKASEDLSKVQDESRMINNKIGEFQDLAGKVMSKYQSTYKLLSELKKFYEEIAKNVKVQEEKMTEVILKKDRKISDMKKECCLLKGSLTNNKMQIAQLTQELLTEKRLFREDFVRLSSEIDRLATASVESSATLEAANLEVNRLDHLVKQKEGEMEKLKIKLEDTKKDVDKQKSERQSAEEQKGIMKNEINFLNSEILQLRTKNAEQLEVITQESAQRLTLENNVVMLKEEIQNLKKNNESYEQAFQEKLRTTYGQIQMLAPIFDSLFQEECTRISELQDDLLLQREISQINEQNLILQAKEIEDMRNESAHLKDSLISLREEAKKLELLNQELKIENELKHSKIARLENQITAEKLGILQYKAENEGMKEKQTELLNQIEMIRGIESTVRSELSDVKSTNAKLSEERSQYKKALEESESGLQEMQQKLTEMKLKYEASRDEITQLNTKTMRYDTAIENGTMKIAQLNQVISDLTVQLEYSRQELASQKLKEKNLQEKMKAKETEILEIVQKCELMQETIKMNEKKTESAISEKNEEIKALQMELDSRNNERGAEKRKLEKKFNETVTHVGELKEQTKRLTQEKRELTKTLTATERKLSSLEKEILLKTEEKEQQIKEKEFLIEKLNKLAAQVGEQQKKLATNEMELEQLRKVEQEYREFQHQVYTNSPPASSQLPDEIGIKVTQTPKSPALSFRLHTMSVLKTPQKTPRSILKQPGSASKRRRVFFAAHADQALEDDKIVLDPVDADEDYDQYNETNLFPCNLETPKSTVRQLSTPERVSNIRKTPRKSGPKVLEMKIKTPPVKASADWFECDKLFGIGSED